MSARARPPRTGTDASGAAAGTDRHDVSILLLSVQEAERLTHSLPAAAAQGAREVVVVDDASTDATADLAAAHGARLVRLDDRVSYAAAMNAGIAACTGAWVLWCNADCVLAPGALDALDPARRPAGVGSVAPRLLRAADVATAARRAAARDLVGAELDTAAMRLDRRAKNGLVGHGEPATSRGVPGPVFGGDGACVLWRAAALAELGGPRPGEAGAGTPPEVLDEELALWASDVDCAWRAQLLGWSAAYEPAALAWHVRFYSPSTRGAVDAAHRRLQFRNRLLMAVKALRPRDLPRVGPALVLYEVLALGHVLLRERDLLPAYGQAWRALSATLARRRRLRTRARGRAGAVPFGLRPPRA